MKQKNKQFPENFLWGSATSAHQVEGTNIHNDWHLWEQANRIKDKQVSGDACNHYNLFKQDIDILSELNQGAFRFSIEWSRIEKTEGQFDIEEIQHYREVLEYLRLKGIKSFASLHHFTNPTWIDWVEESSVESFRLYTEVMVKELGDLVDYWITINEPNILAKHGWLLGDFPPGLKNPASMMTVLDNFIKANNLAYDVIHKHLPDAMVGPSKNNGYYEPATETSLDKAATGLTVAIRNEYFLSKAKFDFIGLNYYSPKKLSFDISVPEKYFAKKVVGDLPKSDMGWEIYPEGITSVLKDLEKYNVPIFITENGLADAGDNLRSDFIQNHLQAVLRAIDEGVDVRGYLYWSLLDNFEWGFGYRPRFGLVHVNYETQERTIRPSAIVYAEICKNNSLK